MDSYCLRQDLLPGSTRLFLDYLYAFSKVAPFYQHAPYDPASFRRAADAIRYPSSRRAQLAAALEEQNPANPLLQRFGEPDTVAVLTGQQVGYLGGPAYTIFKALSAIHVAEWLSTEGVPAVPVFWLASEDHDLAEVDHAWLFDAGRQPVRYQAESGHSGDGPVGIRMSPPVDISVLQATFSQLPFGAEAAALAAEAYRPGRSYAEAFRALVETILGRDRMLFLDPMKPTIRAAAAPFLAQAAEQFPSLHARVEEASAKLAGSGYHAQVHLEPDSTFFFLLEADGRRALKWKSGGFANGKRSMATGDVAAAADRISPNALLRPVLQDYLLPTVTLVGGPAEIAYLAQSAPLYDQLLGRQPVFLPRNGFTLLDEHAARQMARYQVEIPAFFSPEDLFTERLGHTRIPAELLRKMETTQGQVTHALDELRRELLSFDPTLAAASERSHQRVRYQFQKLERKTAREIARREDRVRADAAYLRGLVYPNKHLQERLYSFLPFLATHGAGLVDVIYRNIHANCPDHHVLTV